MNETAIKRLNSLLEGQLMLTNVLIQHLIQHHHLEGDSLAQDIQEYLELMRLDPRGKQQTWPMEETYATLIGRRGPAERPCLFLAYSSTSKSSDDEYD